MKLRHGCKHSIEMSWTVIVRNMLGNVLTAVVTKL